MDNIEMKRHSCSHVLAAAVQELFPGTKLGIGPAIENGFYYDFLSDHKFTPEDLKTIEDKMKQIVKSKEPFVRKEISKSEAEALFKSKGEDFKVELISELPEGEISIYTNGSFVDLCRGPHVEHTGVLKF